MVSVRNCSENLRFAFAHFPHCVASRNLCQDESFLLAVMKRHPFLAGAVLHPDVYGPWDEKLAGLMLALENQAQDLAHGDDWYAEAAAAIEKHTRLAKLRWCRGDKNAVFPLGHPDLPWSALSPQQKALSRLKQG